MGEEQWMLSHLKVTGILGYPRDVTGKQPSTC